MWSEKVYRSSRHYDSVGILLGQLQSGHDGLLGGLNDIADGGRSVAVLISGGSDTALT